MKEENKSPPAKPGAVEPQRELPRKAAISSAHLDLPRSDGIPAGASDLRRSEPTEGEEGHLPRRTFIRTGATLLVGGVTGAWGLNRARARAIGNNAEGTPPLGRGERDEENPPGQGQAEERNSSGQGEGKNPSGQGEPKEKDLPGRDSLQENLTSGRGGRRSPADEQFLDDLEKRTFLFFWEQSDPNTGITRDRTRGDGGRVAGSRADAGSTGATGFSLTALCIGAERGWISRGEARARVRATLRSYAEGPVANEHGWFYHFVDVKTGGRAGQNEMSTSDCTWLVAGALTTRSYFSEDSEIARLATLIYEQTDYQWMRNGHPTLMAHGWRPESGFIKFRYDKYCQLACMYLLGIASPTHALPAEAWYAWGRPQYQYDGYRYIGPALLWCYQFPFAWFDLRGRHEARGAHIDWFENCGAATRAHRAFCLDLNKQFPGSYSENIWGITSSLSRTKYRAWGGPPAHGGIDGSVVPCAAAGSLMFCPEMCLAALRTMKDRFGERIYRRYGFTDAFHPVNGWAADDVIGIDMGITLLAVENLRTGNVWKWFMANPEPRRALDLAEM
jgi:hypothetical protein